jgi:hypothetical protein
VVSFLSTFDLPAVKINAEPLFKRLFPQNPLIEQKLTLAFQLTSQELKQDVPFKKMAISGFPKLLNMPNTLIFYV